MTDKEEENADVETLAQSISTDEEEPATSMNPSQNSHDSSQLQQLQEPCVALESKLLEQKNWTQDELQQHPNDSEECSRLMKEDRKSPKKEVNAGVETLAQSMSTDEKEPATGMNPSQNSHDASQLQQLQEACAALEFESRGQKNWIQEQLLQHSNDSKRMIREECGRLVKEDRKSFVKGERLDAELNQLKISLESDETRRLDLLRADLEQRLDKVSCTFQQQLESVQYEFDRQLNGLRGQLRTAWLIAAAVLIVLFATITVDLKSWTGGEKQPPIAEEKSTGLQREIAVKLFVNGSKELRHTFPSQSDRLWRIMLSATLPIIEEDDPTHPAVILLVASKGNSAVAECLAGRYAALVTESLNAAEHATFNCEMYAQSDPDDAKTQLNTVLTRAFDTGSKSGVVLRLEKLPGPAAMIFYRFADNDNAPFKDVAIVLTLTLESTDTGSARDDVAYNELRKVWGSGLDADAVDPLLSRIGNSVAFVQPETTEVLARLNCA